MFWILFLVTAAALISQVATICDPPCDTICQTCSNNKCLCRKECQSVGSNGCCPNELSPYNGICLGINNKTDACISPGSFDSRLKCCENISSGVSLAFFPNLLFYQAVCQNFLSDLPEGAAILVGVARVSSLRSLDFTANFTTVADLQDPPPFQYWANDALLNKTVNRTVGFMIKNGSDASKWYTSDGTGPTWFLGFLPIAGYFGICQYFPQPNISSIENTTASITTHSTSSNETNSTSTALGSSTTMTFTNNTNESNTTTTAFDNTTNITTTSANSSYTNNTSTSSTSTMKTTSTTTTATTSTTTSTTTTTTRLRYVPPTYVLAATTPYPENKNGEFGSWVIALFCFILLLVLALIGFLGYLVYTDHTKLFQHYYQKYLKKWFQKMNKSKPKISFQGPNLDPHNIPRILP